jgi:hypothetical protein
MRTVTRLFLPHDLAEAISKNEPDYTLRTGPVLIDVSLSRFIHREEWTRLC